MIGIATTCLSETIGDDVPMFIKAYQNGCRDEALPALVHVSTPSYQGTHMQGFHGAVRALVTTLAESSPAGERPSVNLFPGMVSPSDLRQLKEMVAAFDLEAILVPDYSDTLNGPLWTEYQPIPQGGTRVEALRRTGGAAASIECGLVLAGEKETAGTWLEGALRRAAASHGASHRYPPVRPVLRIALLRSAAGRYRKNIPPSAAACWMPWWMATNTSTGCGRPCSAKKIWWPDWPPSAENWALSRFCAPPAAAMGALRKPCKAWSRNATMTRCRSWKMPISSRSKRRLKISTLDLLIGHSKGYTMSRRLKRPLIRVGFPVHDRVDGSRMLHLGYRGAQQLFDRIANTLIEEKQKKSDVGYTYYVSMLDQRRDIILPIRVLKIFRITRRMRYRLRLRKTLQPCTEPISTTRRRYDRELKSYRRYRDSTNHECEMNKGGRNHESRQPSLLQP